MDLETGAYVGPEYTEGRGVGPGVGNGPEEKYFKINGGHVHWRLRLVARPTGSMQILVKKLTARLSLLTSTPRIRSTINTVKAWILLMYKLICALKP
eukprot:912670-Amorphochlora_amoeboformis.AAC.1